MSSIAISGDTSGAVTIAAPAVAGTNTMTLVAGTGPLAPKVLSTAVASTSGTSIDFTNIPSWVTRITAMLNGVSTTGTSNYVIQIGSGSFTTSGYGSSVDSWTGATAPTLITTGFGLTRAIAASNIVSGVATIITLGNNSWAATSVIGGTNAALVGLGGGSVALSGTLDRVRITTVGGTDTFDAGTINIMYE